MRQNTWFHLFEVEPCIDFIYSYSGDLKLAGLRWRDKSVGRGWSLRAGARQAPPVLALLCLALSSQPSSREPLANWGEPKGGVGGMWMFSLKFTSLRDLDTSQAAQGLALSLWVFLYSSAQQTRDGGASGLWCYWEFSCSRGKWGSLHMPCSNSVLKRESQCVGIRMGPLGGK